MTGNEALAAIEAVRAFVEGDNRERAQRITHHEARAMRICKFHDAGQNAETIARAEDIGKSRVIQILVQNGRAQPRPVQPAAAALPAIRGSSAPQDNVGVAIKYQTQNFAKVLLAYHVRHGTYPATLGLPAFIARCREYGIILPPEVIEAVHAQQAAAA